MMGAAQARPRDEVVEQQLKTRADHAFDPLDPETVRNPGPAYSELAE